MAIDLQELLDGVEERVRKATAEAEQRMQKQMADAVNDGRASDAHERAQAEERKTAADPMTEERIQKQIDAEVSAAIEKAQADHQKELDRIRAEASTVQPGATVKVIEDLLPSIKAIVTKPATK